jgi:phosphopantothenoylcysteine decarboxylase/phosphopantothenate--cysteine ligase
MREAIMERFTRIDVAIKAAAVSDFKVSKTPREKIKKQDRLTLELVRTPDILAEMGKAKKDQILVGFAAETEDLEANAKKKLKAKNLDLVVANDVSREDTGIGKETNQVMIIDRMGSTQELPDMPKKEVARIILDEVVLLLKAKAD